MRQIIVEPSRLEESAGKVLDANGDYERLFRSLYAEVDKMSSAWQGRDNTMFVDQIRGYESDFHQISVIMKQYADFLKNSARAYRETQEELVSQASRLNA